MNNYWLIILTRKPCCRKGNRAMPQLFFSV